MQEISSGLIHTVRGYMGALMHRFASCTFTLAPEESTSLICVVDFSSGEQCYQA